MSKQQNDLGLDAALDWFADCDLLIVCTAQPTTYVEATATYALADVALTPGNGNGDFVLGNGDTSGRKSAVQQQANIDIDASGTAQHIALCKSGDTTLRYVTTCTSQALTSGGTVTVPEWDIEIADADGA